jgi:hypothetical protein
MEGLMHAQIDHTDEQIADMVRERRTSRVADSAVRSVAAELGLDWRKVLAAYRTKYPLLERTAQRTLGMSSAEHTRRLQALAVRGGPDHAALRRRLTELGRRLRAPRPLA